MHADATKPQNFTDCPVISIIVGSTRPQRFGDVPARWIEEVAREHSGAEINLLDLRDFPLQNFDAPIAPAYEPIPSDVARRWAVELKRSDGYIFITAEYNHSITGALKNAIDHAFHEFRRKPAAFVGYGGAGGARAIEHLRNILVELQVAPIRSAVHVGLLEFRALKQGAASFADYPYLEEAAKLMLDDLMWWTRALREARAATIENS